MPKRQKQQSFQGEGFDIPKKSFGGHSFKTNAKTSRPMSSKLPVHLVLRCDGKKFSMKKHRPFNIVDRITEQTTRKYGVKLYEFANVGNHLHLLIKIRHVGDWSAFIRELTGKIAHELQGLGGRQKGEKFWIFRPFTRIVAGWRKAYEIAKDYVILNRLEGMGVIKRKETKRLSELHELFGWRVT